MSRSSRKTSKRPAQNPADPSSSPKQVSSAPQAGPNTRSAGRRAQAGPATRVSPPRLYSEVAQCPPATASSPTQTTPRLRSQHQPTSGGTDPVEDVTTALASSTLAPNYTDLVLDVRERALKALPPLERLAWGVAEALNSQLDQDCGETQFKDALFSGLWSALQTANQQAAERAGPWGPDVKIHFVSESCIANVKFADGGGKPYEETRLFAAWSAAQHSARQLKQQRSIKVRRTPTFSEEASAINSPIGVSTPDQDLNDPRSLEQIRQALSPAAAAADHISTTRSQLLGPICPDLLCQVYIKEPGIDVPLVASTGVFDVKAPRLRPGQDELQTSASLHRHSLAQTIAYCQVNRQMGGLGLGMAICGSSFSRVWAVTDHVVAVEVCAGIRRVGTSEMWTVRQLFPRRVLRPLLAHSFLDGSTWQRQKMPRLAELNMDAIAIYRDYLKSCIELAPLVMGPTGPLAMPATIAPPIIDIEGVKIDASNASDTHRLYEILRGVCSSTPGATPVSSVASSSGRVESELGPSDSVSQTGLGEISEELIDELDGQVGVVVVEEGNATQEQWMRRVSELVARRARQVSAQRE